MHRLILFAIFSAAALAQADNPFKPKPSAEVDQTLRARIKEFYDLHIQGQFRKAEELVAEDTKDYFYTHDKPKFLSCEITTLDYLENFTKANAIVTCERFVMMPGFTNKPMKVPGASAWKLVDGKWYWYVDQEALRNRPIFAPSPSSTPPAQQAAPAPAAPAAGGATPALPPGFSMSNIPTTGDFLMKLVKMEPQAVKLKPGESAHVTLTNTAPGQVDLLVTGKLPGVEAAFDHANLKSGEKATLTFTAAKSAKASGVLTVQVEQTTQTLPVQVTIVE